MSQPVRLGIVGCGSVMQGSYMPQIERLRRRGLVEIVAACDINQEKREQVRIRWGIEQLKDDYRALIEDPAVDLVLVLTSMPMHGPITRTALEAGKHVLVEKPMAVTLEDAADLIALAKRSPGRLLCAPHVVLSPTYQAIRQRIQAGAIGRPLSARALYGWSGPDWSAWFYQPGGGALFDVGVYNVTTLTGLLGPAKRVTALAGVAIPERTVEGRKMSVEAVDNAHVLLDFGRGVYAVITTGFTIQQYRCPAVEIYGSEGTIQMLGDDWAPRGYELWENSKGCWQLFDETAPAWAWTDGLRHLVECIQSGAEPIIRPEHAYHVLEIMLKAEQAGKDGRARDIQSTFTPPSFGETGQATPAHLVHNPDRQL
ncbi:MAG: Gfo/Idh/MocA family protein [Chloroflexota bacterium]